MNNVSRVNVVDTFKYLTHDVASLLLRKCHDRCEVVEQLTVTTELKHQKDECVGLEYVLEFN